MDSESAKDLASDAIRYFFHGNREDDNAFAHDNLYRAHRYSHRDAETLHHDTGVLLFEMETSTGLECFNALLNLFINHPTGNTQ